MRFSLPSNHTTYSLMCSKQKFPDQIHSPVTNSLLRNKSLSIYYSSTKSNLFDTDIKNIYVTK
jgi:hypothetical protein